MSYVLRCKIEIGAYIFTSVNNVRIEKSRKTIGDTATITMPARFSDKFLANVLKNGDVVKIELQYQNYPSHVEFQGYISEINPGRPVVIRCEDEMYKLKRKKPETKSFQSVKLKDVLHYLVPECVTQCPDITLSPFYIKKDSSIAFALQKLKDEYGLDVYFRNNTLFAGIPYTDPAIVNTDAVIYNMDLNVKPNPPLTFKVADSVRMKVKAISILPSNQKLETEVGDQDGSVITLHFYNIKTKDELKKQAEEKLKTMKFDGFSGNIVSMGLPYIEHGYTAKIIDNRDANSRSGYYFADAVNTTFGISGFSREVFLGRRAR
ncbi:MAG: hypothetical protein NTZ33_12960 [Bacteroidetes bacterium]|nr:hypothetical protein [Bacteroidota bacterium]